VGLAFVKPWRDGRLAWASLITTAFSFASLLLTHWTSKPLWDHVAIMQYGQFPWRLLSVPTVGVCLLLPALPVALEALALPALWRKRGLIVAGLAISGCYLISAFRYHIPPKPDNPPYLLNWHPEAQTETLFEAEQWKDLPFRIRTAIADEYGPIWRASRRPMLHLPGSVLLKKPLHVTGGEDDRYWMRFEVENPSSLPQSFTVAYNYYPAWQVSSEPSCPTLTVAPTQDMGYIQVQNIPPGKFTIHLFYGDTPIRAHTKTIAAGVWLVWLGGLLMLGAVQARWLLRRRSVGR
jgi:hypothetical protein